MNTQNNMQLLKRALRQVESTKRDRMMTLTASDELEFVAANLRRVLARMERERAKRKRAKWKRTVRA